MSKSSVSLWARDLPKPAPSAEHMAMMREARWGPYRRKQAILRQQAKLAAATVMGSADLYRRIEGWWYGIVVGATSERQMMQ